MTKQRIYGIISAFVAVIIWGSVFPVKEYLLNYMSPISINFFNALVTSFIYFIFIIMSKKSLKIGCKSIFKFILAGIIGISITRLTCDIGINRVGGVTASVFSSLIPIMCVLFNCFFFKKFPDKIILSTIVLSTLGIFMVIGFDSMEQMNFLGYVSLFVSNCAWILYCYFCNNSDKKTIAPSVSMFYQFLGSTIFLSPTLLFRKTDYSVILNTYILWSILFLGIANGVIAYGLFSLSIKTIGVLFSNIINNFIPVVTLLIGIFIFGEKIIILQILGIVLILLSVFFITIYKDTW